MFVEEGRGAIIKKRTKMNRGEGGCPSMCVCSLFLKKCCYFQIFMLEIKQGQTREVEVKTWKS